MQPKKGKTSKAEGRFVLHALFLSQSLDWMFLAISSEVHRQSGWLQCCTGDVAA